MTDSRPVDYKARKQACDVNGSFIIQAPAGSGKTELLIQRYLALLARVEEPESILAITFTKKAAAEMRERVIDALKTSSIRAQDPEAEHEKETRKYAKNALAQNNKQQWNLLKNPQRLQIQTIDSFCAGLTKRLPYLSELGSDANTTEQPNSLYRQAARETLDLIDEPQIGPYIARLLLHLDGNRKRTEKLLIDMLAKRDQWLPHVSQSDTESFRHFLEQSLQTLVSQEITDLADILNNRQMSELAKLCYFARENLLINGRMSADFETIFDDQGDFPGAICLANYQHWQAVIRWVMTKSKTILKTVNLNHGFPPAPKDAEAEVKALYKNNKQAIITLLEQFRPDEHRFVEMAKLPATHYTDEQWELLEALIVCLKYAAANLRLEFVQKGTMDFQEVSMKASSALGDDDDPTDLTLVLDYQLQHILIDEFQDTSHSQYELLSKLLRGWQTDDGKTLFLVGDPMQSIYKFREADVGLFLHVRKHGIAQVQPRPLQLQVNFRSTCHIVNWVNHAFVKIFPENEDITRGAVSYAKSIANDSSDLGGVEIYPHFSNSAKSEAETVTELVKNHIQNNPGVDLAILVKARGHLTELIPALQAADLNFRATEIEQLGHRPVITDMQMLTRALIDPTDRIAWYALLRAPWCGLLLDDLLKLSGRKDSSILINCQQQHFTELLSIDGQRRIKKTINCILPWTIQRSHQNLRHNIEGCWLSLDGPAYIDENDLQAVELYLDLISSLSDGGTIKDPENLQDQLDQLYAPVPANANPHLNLMTIHKSKGLQFDTVILPNLSAGGRHDDNTLLRWMRASLEQQTDHQLDNGLLMGPIHTHPGNRDRLYDYLTDITRTQLEYESGRQLYVACTRAKRRLVLTGTIALKDNTDAESLSAPKGSRLAQLWSVVEQRFLEEFNLNASSQEVEELSEEVKDYRLIRTVDPDQMISKKLFLKVPYSDPEFSSSTQEQLPYYSSTMKRHVGTLTHNWLEHIADQIESWPVERLKLHIPVFAVQLKQMGVGKSDLAHAVDLVYENLRQTLSDPQGIFLLSKHQQSVNELALERLEDSGFRTYFIDRSFIDDDGFRWIIDYKTSTHQGTGLKKFLSEQQNYYKIQLENYASLFTEIESVPIKLALYFTAYQKLIQWDYSYQK